MGRLAEYFCIIGVQDKSELCDQKELRGCVIQKFPENDWKSSPCPQGLEHFCQPGGWYATTKKRQPTFFVAILTDVEGKASYLACLTFLETVHQESSVPNGLINPSDVSKISNVEKSYNIFHVPTCLCIISRQKYFNTLKDCLNTIFYAYLNGQTELIEKIIGTMLGFVNVPPPGGSDLNFSLGGGDEQIIQPPLSADLPTTNDSVAVLFNQLGVHTILMVFTALITESKILLLSSSYSHLTLAAEALASLLYPMKFNYVFIPILPSSLLDFLTAPTPFLMGVHTSYEHKLPELFDVVIVNIDEGCVTVPESIHLVPIPEPYYSCVLKSLKMLLTPSIFTSDLLILPEETAQSPNLQDKELRAVFIKLFADMFCGYRACLTLIRVYPHPVISFNKMQFMEKRGFTSEEFFSKVFDSVSFSAMTQGRGPPYRPVDMFDELIAKVDPPLKEKDIQELLADLVPIVEHLCQNEPRFDNPQCSNIPDITADSLRKPLKDFPLLNAKKINSLIREKPKDKSYEARELEFQQVPISSHDHPVSHFINQRRLEVLQDCIQYIYENKISEARKAMPSVLRALKGKGAQLALCNELEFRVNSGHAMLEHDQYNLIVRLINAALQDDSTMNSITVAAKFVPLAAAFHRKLGPSVVQFAYTTLQDHAIWSNMQFWEEAFYTEVQRQIVELHTTEKRKKLKSTLPHNDEREKIKNNVSNNITTNDKNNESISLTVTVTDSKNRSTLLPSTPVSRVRPVASRGNSYHEDDKKEGNGVKDMPDAMKLAAELLSEWDVKDGGEKERLIFAEESIIYSLTMLFAQRMMYLRVPTNACTEMRKIQMLRRKAYEKRRQQLAAAGERDSPQTSTDDSASISLKRSAILNDGTSTRLGAGSILDGNSDWGSQYDLTDTALEFVESVKDSTSKFILRFVERVCIEAGVTAAHLKSLQQNIPMLVGMHIEALEEVYRETKDAPKMKAKITEPVLLQEEILQLAGLRCYLVHDGRELGVRTENSLPNTESETNDDDREINIGADIGGPCLLPAEGALFLTNYRVIFKGSPVDQFASEMTVTRSFPIGALIKEKRNKAQIQISPGIITTDILQLRSSTMQLLRLAFDDEEVLSESIETFRKTFIKSRWPPSVYNTFAFNYKAAPVLVRTLSQRQHSIRKTHRSLGNVVHLKKIVSGKESLRGPQKVAMAEDKTARKYTAVNKNDEDDDDMQQVILERDHRGADPLSKSSLCKDYDRLELGTISKDALSGWRLSMMNFHYNSCRGYPAIIVIPSRISDDTVLKIAKNYRLNRIPVAVWKHKKTKGTLMRAGAINKTVLAAVLKTELGGKRTQGNLSSNVNDDEKYFTEIVNATRIYTHKGKAQTVSAGAALSVQAMSSDFATLLDGSDNYQQLVEEKAEIKNWVPAQLYVFTDKSVSKGAKMESSSRIVVVNVDLHDVQQVKTSFAKLSKVSCPSRATQEKSFLSALEDSKWMSQLSSLLQVACSIVNLIDIQGSSCLVSFGDGSEVTAQVVSLVQILSDPYYRTIEGFKVLIEKDWLAFGYRFSHRGNHMTPVQPSIAPFFLQFLDCVYQIICQYPYAFEFNNYFLKFIAYHQSSMRFNTFFLDSEHERYQHGWFPDTDIPKQSTINSKTRNGGVKGNSNRQSNIKAEQLVQQQIEQQKKKSTSVSLWDYLDIQARKFTLFNSFNYHSALSKTILQPFCNISNLEIWDYYTAENLYTGPTYDLELVPEFDIASPGNETSANMAPDVEREDSQRCFTGSYGDTLEFPRDEVTYLLNELSRLKEELDQSAQNWSSIWDDLDVKELLKRKSRQMNWQDYWGRERRIALQKRATLDMVTKGKVTGGRQARQEFGFELPHDFVYHNYILTSICNYCLQGIAGLHAGLQCSQCGFNVHEKCQSMVPSQCAKHPSIGEQPDSEPSSDPPHISFGGRTSTRNFKGTLYKRGHYLRQWKARWFVLDAEKNRLTYYNSEEDTQLQGYIDLGEVRATLLKNAPQGAPKGDSRTYFELETTKRNYQLAAAQQDTAEEWVDRFNLLNV